MADSGGEGDESDPGTPAGQRRQGRGPVQVRLHRPGEIHDLGRHLPGESILIVLFNVSVYSMLHLAALFVVERLLNYAMYAYNDKR